MLPASRHRVNAARAWSGDAPASPQAGVITACSGHVSSGSPSRVHSLMTRSAACLASALPSPGPVGPVWARRAARFRVRSRDSRHDAGQQAQPRLRGLGYPVHFPPP